MSSSAPAGSPGRQHTCVAYDGGDDFLGAGVRFLADGVDLDERLIYVSGRPQDQMRRDVAPLGSATELEDAGMLTLVSYAEAADLDALVVPAEQVAFFASATAQAVADGHRGLRVLAELTGLARDPHRHARLLQYEHLADRYMSDHPMSALCALDRTALGEEQLAEAEAVHPHVDGPGGLSGFRLLPDEDGLRVTGVVDAWEADRLGHLLRTIAARDSVVRLHLEDLTFIGARGLHALDEYRRDLDRHGGRLELIDPRPVVQRACDVLGVDLRGQA